MYSIATTPIMLLLSLTGFPDVVISESTVNIRNGQLFSRFKCPSNNGTKVVCASDNATKVYNFSSREQCCANCHSFGWSWFNFIDNEDQTKNVGGECQLFDQKPKISAEKTRCSLYKVENAVLQNWLYLYCLAFRAVQIY